MKKNDITRLSISKKNSSSSRRGSSKDSRLRLEGGEEDEDVAEGQIIE